MTARDRSTAICPRDAAYFLQEAASGWARSRWLRCCRALSPGRARRSAAPAVARRSAGSTAWPLCARAKAVIHLFMAGAPSHLDLFDYKPKLAEFEGKPIPPEVIGGQRYAFIRADAAALGPRFKFTKHGQCGAEIADVLPHLAGVVDDICLVRSMHTDQFNHAPAQIFLNTGFSQPGRPSMGSWVTYGLGAETRDLPAFVVMSTGTGISGGAANWSSGFLPTVYAGVRFRNQGDPILDVSSPAGIDARTAARDARPGRRTESAATGHRSAIPKSARASRRTRWLSGCKPRPPS